MDHMKSSSSILPVHNPSDKKLNKIEEPSGAIINPANTVALIFDRDEWGEIPSGPYLDSYAPATDLEILDRETPQVLVVSGKLAKSWLSASYIDGISQLIGVNLRKHPDKILISEHDSFPILVNDTKSVAEIMVAPRIPPEEM